ncbi:hypothetical protein NDU88_003011 [Pleurodeles waltl]|uniref:Uncharacterized protein n=1 Tax=Pleurodeles waltl TaxID=8319 RepID=A0AAV7LKC5_PLEWA|nr:hypothetical protein NDU88_003011 [Pleurodeles waltl]
MVLPGHKTAPALVLPRPGPKPLQIEKPALLGPSGDKKRRPGRQAGNDSCQLGGKAQFCAPSQETLSAHGVRGVTELAGAAPPTPHHTRRAQRGFSGPVSVVD